MAERMLMVPKRDWDEVRNLLAHIKSRQELDAVISEKEAAELLGVTVSTLQTKRSKKIIPENCYTRPKVGNVVYFRDKLLNLSE